jgi:hypothetical protein
MLDAKDNDRPLNILKFGSVEPLEVKLIDRDFSTVVAVSAAMDCRGWTLGDCKSLLKIGVVDSQRLVIHRDGSNAARIIIG